MFDPVGPDISDDVMVNRERPEFGPVPVVGAADMVEE
jgi:hypothetical protein